MQERQDVPNVLDTEPPTDLSRIHCTRGVTDQMPVNDSTLVRGTKARAKGKTEQAQINKTNYESNRNRLAEMIKKGVKRNERI